MSNRTDPVDPDDPVSLIKKPAKRLETSTAQRQASLPDSARATQSQVTSYDLTIWHDKFPDRLALEVLLRKWFSKYAYQLEAGTKNGTKHWQFRGRLIVKRRLHEIKSQLGPKLPGAHISITSKDVHDGVSFNYVLKDDTRIEGPWTDEDWEEPPTLTRQLIQFQKCELRPYQKELYDLIQIPEDRFITVVLDKVGNTGKSIFAEYLEYERLAYEIPPFNSFEDIAAVCMSIKAQKCYLVDMPRGLKKSQLSSFFAGLEALKNGVMFDKRYSFKKRRIDRPQIVLFTNDIPDLSLLSIDRWRFFSMNNDYTITHGFVNTDPDNPKHYVKFPE